MKYKKAIVKITLFNNEDVIQTSGQVMPPCSGTPELGQEPGAILDNVWSEGPGEMR